MEVNLLAWNIYFVAIFLAGIAIIAKEKSPRFPLYGVFGALYAGFLFDPVSVWLGYYTFNLPFRIFGVPWAVIAAEFFSVIVVIWCFEKASELFGRHFPNRLLK